MSSNCKLVPFYHVKKFYEEDSSVGLGLRMVPKLKYEHLHINSFSAMRVDLAAKVLSESVSHALHLRGGEEASETARFIGLKDNFFDCLNVHNFSHGARALKPFQMPYLSPTDFRLKWLKEVFLGYLKDWKSSVEQPRELKKTEQNLLLLSCETRFGLEMTGMSFLELVPYLFSLPDVQSFLSQRLCQDPLECFFGLQRQRATHIIQVCYCMEAVSRWYCRRESSAFPKVYQYVGHFMFKEKVKSHYAIDAATSGNADDYGLTCSEMYALRYPAGYVPRTLRRKLEKCKKKKIELLNCIGDMQESDDSVQSDSTNWIKCVDRGGLTFVNSQTFELFLAMELEVRSHLQGPGKPVNFMSDIAPKVKNNEDVLFCWSMLSSSWDEESSKTLFKMVVDLWLTIRGYSNASAWIEKYKVSQMKSTQKSKGIRKHI
eukprot:Em0011g437a